MYSAERKQEILLLLEKNAHVHVDQLASHFGVSRSSIRRDLNHLHEDGLLARTYGGAVALPNGSAETPFKERQVANFAEKDRIGKAAVQLIEDGDTIFIDGGTTTECMTPYLLDRRITVVTYGLNIINQLSCSKSISLIVIGGTLHPHSLTFGGALSLGAMQSYNIRFDKAFIAASGISAVDGITNASLEEVPIKRKAIEVGQCNILLVDSSKIGVTRAAYIAPLQDVHRVITGVQASPSQVAAIRAIPLVVELV
ncbi:MAG: DeoR/GlpR family DNA-binding transcription regulator [Caldilineaceae bacterium]